MKEKIIENITSEIDMIRKIVHRNVEETEDKEYIKLLYEVLADIVIVEKFINIHREDLDVATLEKIHAALVTSIEELEGWKKRFLN